MTSRATGRSGLIAALAAVVVLVVATTAVAVVSLGSGGGDVRPGPVATIPERGPGAATPWAWMHGGRVRDEAEYLSRMVAHHREAVAAAGQLARSDRPRMRAFGADIVATQSAQIDQMNGWLDQWYPERPADSHYRPMMRDLSHLSGDALDRAFLRDMTVHHMAAVMMSQQLLARGLATHPAVSRLARTIRDQQHAEIHRMQGWLHDWYGESWHGGFGWMMGRGYHWMTGGRSMMSGYRWMHGYRWDGPYRRLDRDHGWWNGDRQGMGPSMMR